MTTEERRVYDKKWREANKEKVKARSKKWYENNKERDNAKSKKWRENNIEKRNVYFRNTATNLTKSYVANRLKIPLKYLTPELYEQTKLNVKIKRLINEKQRAIKSSGNHDITI